MERVDVVHLGRLKKRCQGSPRTSTAFAAGE